MNRLWLDSLTRGSEVLTLKSVTKSAVLTRSQKAVQRLMIRVHMIQHWYSRDKHFQYVTLLTNHVHIYI
jgi:hypothetical protein